MEYPTLEKLFHIDTSSDRFSAHERLLRERMNGESSFRTGIELNTGELFLAIPRELSIATERILRCERRVFALWRELPTIALGAFIRSLIMDEVVFSNEIEGVHSTRRQIEAALESQTDKHTPFVEFAHMYLKLIDNPMPPTSLADVRAIYDAVTVDAIAPKDIPRASLFRTGPVEIVNHQGRTVHKGVEPSETIEQMMEQWLALSLSEEMPELYSSILCHFLFEYIHPFYDGNGRTGRYLLALHLSRPLSQPTVLSLSRIIAENKVTYYKAFDITERKLNNAEGTHFVLTILQLIAQAQEELIADLETKNAAIEELGKRIEALSGSLPNRTCETLFYAAQMHLYNALREFRLAGLTEHLKVSKPTARKTLTQLKEDGMLEQTAMRPPTYRLTGRGLELLGLSPEA